VIAANLKTKPTHKKKQGGESKLLQTKRRKGRAPGRKGGALVAESGKKKLVSPRGGKSSPKEKGQLKEQRA